jgi:hypothetical protein
VLELHDETLAREELEKQLTARGLPTSVFGIEKPDLTNGVNDNENRH